MCWEHFRTELIKQIQPDEAARARKHARIAQLLVDESRCVFRGVPPGCARWRRPLAFSRPKKAGVETAIRYLLPFMLDPSTWKKEQITKYDPKATCSLGSRASACRLQICWNAYRKLPHANRRGCSSWTS